MVKLKLLRKLVNNRKIRKAIDEIYSNKYKVEKYIPIAAENRRTLAITPKGFLYYDGEDINNTGIILKHMPFTNRHYFLKYKSQELLDLFQNLDPERMKKHFDYGLEKKL